MREAGIRVVRHVPKRVAKARKPFGFGGREVQERGNSVRGHAREQVDEVPESCGGVTGPW
ncbi:hypothetical protein AOZ06_28655 [Kibdelosporangium phytohabitans]|uniref:Uncharacterized protein n=1 Tax=Kibdelosporangium phytohabitans TaxID=860235 RepID=A0A0N7F436_9PSEU|nr:hypothetical protein AOZ06_28655 [Kibdelosporangium phytohabitans]